MKIFFTLSVLVLSFSITYSQTTWTAQSSGVASNLNGVAWSGSIFVAVGANGTILTSPTGVVWTPQISGTTNQLNGVNYVNGAFIATGNSGTVLTSPDGLTWTSHSVVGVNYYGAAYGNGTYAAAGSNAASNGVFSRSPNLIVWGTSLVPATPLGFRGVVFSSSLFVAVSASPGIVATSLNGTTWVRRTTGISIALSGVAASPSTFVATGTAGAVISSADGVTWSLGTTPTTANLLGITEAGASTFVVVGQNGTILYSTDGINWASETSGTSLALNAVTHSGSALVAVGAGGTVLRAGFVLPVKLVSFTVKGIGKNRLLSWTTASELNSSTFSLERSDDGNYFHAIGSVPATGNSSVRQDYSFVDSSKASGAIYYRLKQIDIDGRFDYSGVLKYFATENAQLSIYPNPVTTRLFIPTREVGTPFFIINAAGRIEESGMLNASASIDVSALPAGLYFFKLGSNTTSFVKH